MDVKRKVRICGFFDGNFGDIWLRDILQNLLIQNNFDIGDNNRDISILVGGGLSNNITNNRYYLNQMIGSKVKIALLIGVNPVFDTREREYLKIMLKDFDYISVRDKASFDVLKGLGLECDLGCDLAFLEYDKLRENKEIGNEYSLLNITYFSWKSHNEQINFYNEICKLNKNTVCFSNHMQNINEEKLFNEINNMKKTEFNSIYDYKKCFSFSKFIIVSRYHSLILAILLRKPFISLSYNFKMSNLISDFNLQDWEYPCGNGFDGFVSDFYPYEIMSRVNRIGDFKINFDKIECAYNSTKNIIDKLFKDILI